MSSKPSFPTYAGRKPALCFLSSVHSLAKDTMAPDDVYRLYLSDLVKQLREDLEDARIKRDAHHPPPDKKAWDSGVAFAYAAVLSTMKNQAIAFELPLSELGLEGYDSDREMTK